MVGAALLAGGESRRMGRDKNLLLFGAETFQAHIAAQLSDFPERLLSVGARTYDLPGFAPVPDLLPDRGPLGGLCSLLSSPASQY